MIVLSVWRERGNVQLVTNHRGAALSSAGREQTSLTNGVSQPRREAQSVFQNGLLTVYAVNVSMCQCVYRRMFV